MQKLLLRYPDLVDLGLVNNRTTLRRWIDDGRFPQPIRIGPHSIAWRPEEIEAVIEARAAEREVA